MILSRLNHLKQAAKSMDFQNIVSAIRTGLLRNLGGSNNPKLFSQSYSGSKFLIEDYENQVIKTLETVNSGDFNGYSDRDKMDFFGDTIQSFGRTALVLEGGISFGGVHLGVVKALYSQNLLPDIICGSSMGSLIAAYVCVHSNDSVRKINILC